MTSGSTNYRVPMGGEGFFVESSERGVMSVTTDLSLTLGRVLPRVGWAHRILDVKFMSGELFFQLRETQKDHPKERGFLRGSSKSRLEE